MSDGPVCGVGLCRLSLQGALREASFVFTGYLLRTNIIPHSSWSCSLTQAVAELCFSPILIPSFNKGRAPLAQAFVLVVALPHEIVGRSLREPRLLSAAAAANRTFRFTDDEGGGGVEPLCYNKT